MATRDIPVAHPLPSVAKRFTEIIPHQPSSTYFTAVMFVCAPGVTLDDAPEAKARYWNPDLFEQWGEVLAQIHNHAQYHAPKLGIQRPQWHEYDVLDLGQFIPLDQALVLDIFRAHLTKLRKLPKSPECYGLTHTDLTQWNSTCTKGNSWSMILTALSMTGLSKIWPFRCIKRPPAMKGRRKMISTRNFCNT